MPKIIEPPKPNKLDPGNWLIRGVKGEIYPCDKEVFEATYDPLP